MNEKLLMYLVGGLVLVIATFIAIDFVSHHRWDQVTSRNDSNWKWDDNWSDPSSPSVKPNDPVNDQPKPQTNEPQAVMEVRDYNTALATSKQTGRPIVVFFEATWCKWCKKMKSETLTNQAVQQALRPFILVYVDTDQNRSLAQKFGVSGIPAYIITDATQQKLNSGNGFMDTSTFVAWLNNRRG